MFQDRVSDLERYVEALKQENSQLLAGDGTNRSIDSSGSSIRRVSIVQSKLGHLQVNKYLKGIAYKPPYNAEHCNKV